MKRLGALAAGLACGLFLAAIYVSKAGSTPPAQPAMVELTVDSLPQIKAEFNRAASSVRAILLISASCPFCLKGASEIERILKKHPERPAKVFVVWEPILPTDWGKPGTSVLHRLEDGRVRQFWDPTHSIAAELKRAMRGRPSEPDCCERRGVWWDLIAAFPPGAEWTDTLPEPMLLQGTVEDAAAEFDSLLGKT